jgi:hypothetical protein
MGIKAVKHFFKTNYNLKLQRMGLVHIKTKFPINEDKAICTSKSNYVGADQIEVTYWDGVTKTFTPTSWNIYGVGILKNCVIIKIEW